MYRNDCSAFNIKILNILEGFVLSHVHVFYQVVFDVRLSELLGS